MDQGALPAEARAGHISNTGRKHGGGLEEARTRDRLAGPQRRGGAGSSLINYSKYLSESILAKNNYSKYLLH